MRANNTELLHLWATQVVTGVDVVLEEHDTISVTTSEPVSHSGA